MQTEYQQTFKRPIWICGHRKCGTTLLTNLLDGHKSILNYGPDLRMIYALYDVFERFSSPAERKDRFYELFFDDRTESHKIPKETVSSILDQLSFAEKEDIWLYLNFLCTELGRDRHLVIKETSSEHYFINIRDNLDPLFIHTVRDPRDNWAAIAAGLDTYYSKFGETRYEALSSMISRVNLGFSSLLLNLEISDPNNYLVVKFEDLVSEPSSILTKICDRVSLSFSKVLLEPTSGDKKYSGNSHDGEVFTGVSPKNVSRFNERLPSEEVAIIEAFCGPIMEYFGYKYSTNAHYRMLHAEKFYSFFNQRYFYYDKFNRI